MKELNIEDLGISVYDWKRIKDIFQAMYGASCGAVNSSGSFLIGKQQQSEPCKLIQKTMDGKKACKKCHAHQIIKHKFMSEKVILFKCHAGLTQFIIPISDQTAIISPGIPFNPINVTELSEKFHFNKKDFVNATAKFDRNYEVEFTSLIKLIGIILSNSLISFSDFPKIEKLPPSLINLDCETNISKSQILVKPFSKKNKKRRVVITGLGILSPIGIGKDVYLDSLRYGKSGIKRISSFDVSDLPCQIAGEVTNFNPKDFGILKTHMLKGKSIQMAVAASKMAFEDSGLSLSNIDVDRAGISIGTSSGGMEFAEQEYGKFILKKRISHLITITVFGGAASGAVSVHLGFKGPSLTVSTGCVASTDAIGYATQWIKDNKTDIAIAGGTEALITPFVMTSFSELRIVSTNNNKPKEACRPFDYYRDGIVVSEGSGMLILEELEHALARKAHIYGEILGYAATGDAYHMTLPEIDGNGAAKAMKLALLEAGIDIKDIDYISAHGTSTKQNDKMETSAIKKVFGKYSDQTPISAIKSLTGHTIGTSGSIELIGVLLSMENGFIPPTINQEKFDKDCDLDYVPNVARKTEINTVLKNSFAFGGKNASLVIRRYRG